jgi:hypothetical protein
VRGHGKTSGAFRFACPFLCFFLLGKQKKEGKEPVSEQKRLAVSGTDAFVRLKLKFH